MPELDVGEHDFIDLGAGDGGSLPIGYRRFAGTCGVGIELDERKVAAAVRGEATVRLGDATSLDVAAASVRFVTMVDFLEHLPSLAAVERTIESAARAARDFLFISHPSFEGKPYLTQLGLRQYWWHWTGHKSHVTIADYLAMFDRLGLHSYMIRNVGPVHSSSHPTILGTGEPKNQFEFDPAVHSPRPSVEFAQPLWRLQEIFIALRPLEPAEWAAVTRPRSSPSSPRR